MTLYELLHNLSVGELSNLSSALDGAGAIKEESQPKVVNYINNGLLRLYSRYLLKEKDVIIELVEGVTFYHLDSRFAESKRDPNSVKYSYIKDATDPFTDDVIKILSVHNAFGLTLPLNDPDNPHSLFTPQADILQVPAVKDGTSLNVTYQARHPVLSVERMNQKIELPAVLHEALTSYVAARMYGGILTPEAVNASVKYNTRFEEICLDAEKNDFINISISSSGTKFQKRGWI